MIHVDPGHLAQRRRTVLSVAQWVTAHLAIADADVT